MVVRAPTRISDSIDWAGHRGASWLEDPSSPVRGRVLTIPYLYAGTNRRARGVLDSLRDAARGDLTLFRLIGDNSPFADHPYLFAVERWKGRGSSRPPATTDLF